MNVFTHFRGIIDTELAALSAAGDLPETLDTKNIAVEPPRDASHGDIATNAALVLSKQAKRKPRDIAELLAPRLEGLNDVDAVEIAGPGFINLRLASSFWQNQVLTILKDGKAFGSSEMGAGEPVNVEYVSANPTGPLHVGHTRGAVFGDALSNLLSKAGFKVSKEYLINDAGGQIDVLARSSYLRYCEAHGRDIGAIPEGLYPGEYLIPVGEMLKEKYGDKWLDADESEWIETIRDEATDAMMDLIREDLKVLGVEHEVFFSEKTLHKSGRIDEVIADLRERGHIYEGVLEPPKGKKPDDWEAREQTLFRATDFGDDVDRALQKSNGDYTYFGADIAYHYDKYQRGFKNMINVWGADHGGYVKRMQAAVKGLAEDGDLDVKLCQLVRLFRDGEPFKMSKRSGNFITMRDVVDEVGRDVTRFIMLTRKNDAPLDFDFAKVTEQSKDNPVFYVQYAHARICSVIGKAQVAFADLDASDEALAGADVSKLSHESEIAMIQQCAAWPRMVEAAAEAHEPHRIAFFLYDLASEFHTFWNKGNDNPSLRFIIDGDEEMTKARLALIRSVALVIASGLEVLGVTPVEEMR
ncbi:arginine--tRNA ligase [Kordiimonas sp. SCSIO 12603]|uniref:arginine--tRNA ligase n=1 Tax=Kordiimonas sp. SCSIO 12603 TaxID=2829596 RepID=UPI0021053EEA|nr:arginine--tRNA ligase [Kordiimonas sp. SCSIO 12603]UTW57691.1 arginine--tRNA ligase [Kordiimonas sp. SCSIO 12603]